MRKTMTPSEGVQMQKFVPDRWSENFCAEEFLIFHTRKGPNMECFGNGLSLHVLDLLASHFKSMCSHGHACRFSLRQKQFSYVIEIRVIQYCNVPARTF